jgi:hypothetical protein
MVNSIEERGRVRGKREMLRKQLEKRFGPLPPAVLARIETLATDRLDEISLAILDAKSLDELGLSS